MKPVNRILESLMPDDDEIFALLSAWTASPVLMGSSQVRRILHWYKAHIPDMVRLGIDLSPPAYRGILIELEQLEDLILNGNISLEDRGYEGWSTDPRYANVFADRGSLGVLFSKSKFNGIPISLYAITTFLEDRHPDKGQHFYKHLQHECAVLLTSQITQLGLNDLEFLYVESEYQDDLYDICKQAGIRIKPIYNEIRMNSRWAYRNGSFKLVPGKNFFKNLKVKPSDQCRTEMRYLDSGVVRRIGRLK